MFRATRPFFVHLDQHGVVTTDGDMIVGTTDRQVAVAKVGSFPLNM